MPSCEECNKRYKKIEEDLQLRLVLALDPNAPEASGIVERVHRPIDPSRGRDEKDRSERAKRRMKLRAIVIPRGAASDDSIYPNFGPYPELAPEDVIPIGFPRDSLQALAEKIVRGAVCVLDRTFLPADTEITLLPPMHEDDARPLINTITRNGEWHSLGPGFRFGRGEGFFAIQIWGQLWIYGCIRKK
jgi:hypothetical protein